MSQPNPYEAPRADIPLSGQARVLPNQRLIAARMLKAREHGYNLGLFFRWQARRYLVLLAIFGGFLFILAGLEWWPAFWVYVGLVLGMFSRDLGWARAHAKTWPMSCAVTDWGKVQKIADGELTITY